LIGIRGKAEREGRSVSVELEEEDGTSLSGFVCLFDVSARASVPSFSLLSNRPTNPPHPVGQQFEDKYWDSLVSTARYQLSPQGRLVFEFSSNVVTFNNPFSSQGSTVRIPLPQSVGNLGTAFADVSYIDGTMWIEKLRDNATGQVYYTIFEYVGPCEEEEAAAEKGKRGFE